MIKKAATRVFQLGNFGGRPAVLQSGKRVSDLNRDIFNYIRGISEKCIAVLDLLCSTKRRLCG